MDEFDIIDMVYNAISKDIKDVLIIKGRSDTGISQPYIQLNNVSFVESDSLIGTTPVNVNILIPLNNNGTQKRQMMKDLKREVMKAINSMHTPPGTYLRREIQWVQPMPDFKDKYDCLNIRINFFSEL